MTPINETASLILWTLFGFFILAAIHGHGVRWIGSWFTTKATSAQKDQGSIFPEIGTTWFGDE